MLIATHELPEVVGKTQRELTVLKINGVDLKVMDFGTLIQFSTEDCGHANLDCRDVKLSLNFLGPDLLDLNFAVVNFVSDLRHDLDQRAVWFESNEA